jgi:hypothetical protein
MPATRAAMGARGAPARKAVLKARAADMASREEMDCGLGELAELALGVEVLRCTVSRSGLGAD